MTLTSRRGAIHYGEIGGNGRNRPFFERAQAETTTVSDRIDAHERGDA
ncbi:MAG: hypothetical protein U9R72_13150 [Chloroflexota bacterium]|nr:hypothetical protein [Chloroflexota bacterium]